MKRSETIGVREAARQLGCTLKWVYDMLYSGRLDGQKLGKHWRIPAKAVEARVKAREADGH